jgi:hypothetical protein
MNKMSIISKEGFLPKIDNKMVSSSSKRDLGSSSSKKHIKITQYEELASKERVASREEDAATHMKRGGSLSRLARMERAEESESKR